MAVFSNTSFLLLLLFCLSLIQLSSCLSTVSISETSNQTLICALDQRSFLRCRTFPRGSVQIPVNDNSPNITFSGVVSGNGFVCALRSPPNSNSSVILFWRFSVNGGNMSYKRIYHGPELEELEAGNSHICGLVRGSRHILCWQWSGFNPSRTFQNFSSIAVGENFVCGLSNGAGEITCEGNYSPVTGSTVPDGNYSVVAAGFRHACAITLDNDLACWGDMDGVAPSGKFSALALGENRSCALTLSNGTVVCWGSNNFNLPERLREIDFTSIEAKRSVFCGVVTANYSLYCWGNENFDSDFEVFEGVLPEPCRRERECPCGPVLGSGTICSRGFTICQSCERGRTPPGITPVSPEPPPGQEQSDNGTWNVQNIAFLLVGCIGSLSLVAVIGFFIIRQRKSGGGSRVHDSGRLDEANSTPEEPKLEKRLSQLASMGNTRQLEEFSLEELLQATNGFFLDHKIGSGSFGSVYHAVLSDGRHVAIKRAELSNASSRWITRQRQDDKDTAFVNELESLSRLNHKNLVQLLGFYEDSEERMLVYEYLENGTLHDHLHKLHTPLSWPARIRIALDAAHGIQYLHDFAVPPVIHRDIKSSNILLDGTWTAKVSDFGLSQMGPMDDKSHLSLLAAGTVGYMDPEYYRLQKLTTKSDVYSFGVLLLELLSGQRAIHKNEDGLPRNVVDYVLPFILQDEIHRVLDRNVPPPTPYEIEAVAYVGYLAASCVAKEGRNRPPMSEIVYSLERALAACYAEPMALSRSSTESSV